MTVLVGVRCTDGVVIGSDSMATSAAGSFPLMHIPYEHKVKIFQDAVIVATTGQIGLAQRLHVHIEEAVKGHVFKNFNAIDCGKNIPHRFVPDLVHTHAQNHPQEGMRFGGLIAAGNAKSGPFLIEYGPTDFQPEIKIEPLFFVSMGSGQILADPFLAFVQRVIWKSKMPTVEVGKLGVYWVLEHTITLAPGKVGPPIKIATLRKINDVWVAKEEDVQQSSQYVKDLEEYIGDFRAQAEDAATVPVPMPETKSD